MKNEHDVKVLKIDVFNFENSLFDDKSVIVECTLELDSEYIIKAMIDNECIDYSFIDIDIAHQVCEALEISFLKLNKSREVKNYDERRNKNITHVIYSFMIIQNHTKSSISMMITKLDQHSIILDKS
jgi:NMD protein affecting ribosome stability and mRNA decay